MLNEPLPLAHKRSSQTDFSNRLLSRINNSRFFSEDQEFSVNLYNEALIIPEVKYCLVKVSSATHSMAFAIHMETLLKWTNIHFPVSSFYLLPEPVMKRVIEQTLSVLWQWLKKILEQPFTLDLCTLTSGDKLAWKCEHSLSISLSLLADSSGETTENRPELHCLLIDASPFIIDRIIDSFPAYTCKKAQFSQLKWPIELSHGMTTLKLSQVRQLQKNDIIFLEKSPEDHVIFGRIGSSLNLRCKVQSARTLHIEKIETLPMNDNDSPEKTGKLSEDLMETLKKDDHDFDDDFLQRLFQQDESTEEDTQDEEERVEAERFPSHPEQEEDEETASSESGEPETETEDTVQKFDMKQLPVSVHFDIGTATITLEKLESLRKGYCFELPEHINNYVTLKVHNQPIGRGELVKIGDRLGVEITHMNHEDENTDS